MGTIAKQIEDKLGVKLEVFEASHDSELCGFIDFLVKKNGKTLAITLYNGPDNVRHSTMFTEAIKQCNEKFGIHFEICYDGDTIINPDVLDFMRNLLMSRQELDNIIVENTKDGLVVRGLSRDEAETFLTLLNKITVTEKDSMAFDYEMNKGIPFEGGMGFFEALTAMKQF